MNDLIFLIYKEELCLDQESGRTHGRSSPENEHANKIGLDDKLNDGDRKLRDENDDRVEASNIIDEENNPRLRVEATLLKNEPGIPVQPGCSKAKNVALSCGSVSTSATGKRIAAVGTELEAPAPHNNAYQDTIEQGVSDKNGIVQALTLKERFIREKDDKYSKDSKTDLGEIEARRSEGIVPHLAREEAVEGPNRTSQLSKALSETPQLDKALARTPQLKGTPESNGEKAENIGGGPPPRQGRSSSDLVTP